MKNLSLLDINLEKITLFTLGLSLLAFSNPSTADMIKKAPAKINFHQMIEQTSEERLTLESKLDSHYEQPELSMEENEDEKKVIDFVDVEVQWGKDRNTLVDRRYNSVKESARHTKNRVPNSVNERAVTMQVTLIDAKRKSNLPN